jgi:hypothetical protein
MADNTDNEIAPERRREMLKHAFETLVERAQYRAEDVRFIAQLLNRDVAGHWAGAIDAATITSQTVNDAVYHAIDLALSQALKANPLLEVVADLYNELPRDTVALQRTAIEVMRQTVAAGEERGRADTHPGQYLTVLNNYTARLLQQNEFGLAEETALNPSYSSPCSVVRTRDTHFVLLTMMAA